MYFKDREDTSIDDEFNNNNFISKLINFIKKYKLFFIIGLVLVLIVILLFSFKEDKFIDNTKKYLVLYGDEPITIYENSDYIEPGYKAYNSHNEDLNKDVKIESNLDVKNVGEYEINYILDDIVKIRKVIVVSKPEVYTFIRLNGIDGKVDVYLRLGEEYVEPGYQVFSSTGNDLNDKVETTGFVDTSKKGRYKITYFIVDSEGVTISVSRTVTVMDTEINLSLNTNEYTNKDVVIDVKVMDEYFDYMILPDGRKITQNNYSYKVSKNGKYTFKTYNSKGMQKESSIEVKNIDKILPEGSCAGSYSNGSSIVNITSKDASGIKGYVIFGTFYTSSKITIKGELSTIDVTIYDKAGNAKNIVCSLQNKNTEQPKPPSSSQSNPYSEKDNPIYTKEQYHDNSINGVRYILYDQADPRWASNKYPSGNTMANSGCMVTTMAVIASAYNSSITPQTTFNSKHRYNWISTAVNDFTGNSISCVKKSSMSKKEIISYLQKGDVVAIKIQAPHNYTGGQHYMAIIDVSSDGSKIFIGNKSGGTKGWLNADDVLYNMYEFHVCTPTETVINKFR